MTSHKSILKLLIIFILAVFFLSTALISVLYLGGSKNSSTGTGDVVLGTVVESGITDTSVVDSGTTGLPKMTKEEASKKIQELLSGLNDSGATK